MYEEKQSPLSEPGEEQERGGEIAQETRRLRSAALEANSLAEALIKRLAPIISPTPDKNAGTEDRTSSVTPYATVLREIGDQIDRTNRSLSFILQGLEI